MESDAAPPSSGISSDGTIDAEVASTADNLSQPTPITNVILSHAVTSAISQLDTKRAFDMMLLNEQMTAMEAEYKCLKEEKAFLRDALAKQSHETNEMYHYFHGKMDTHVATITALENELAVVHADHERLKEQHAQALSKAQCDAQVELTKATSEIANLRDELYQVQLFVTQKKQMEELVRELQDEVVAKEKQFAADKNALELKALFEKDRVKKEMMVHMQDTKEALLLRTDEQLNTTTKRTMMENDHCMEELSFQSRETEKLLMRFRHVEDEAQRLRVENKVLEANELVLTKKNHYYQKILSQLKKQSKEPEKQVLDRGDEDAALVDQHALRATKEELTRLQAKILVVEESLKHAQQWIHAFQHEKQFVVAQQDEIIQFLCRALADTTSDWSCRQTSNPSERDPTRLNKDYAIAETAKSMTTMEELVSTIAPIALDELSSDETRQILLLLLEKMKMYQDQVATTYRRRQVFPTSPLASKASNTNREMLSKQLGVELPPIAQATAPITSPLKVKRRIHPHAPTTGTSTTTSRPPPLNPDLLFQQCKPKASNANMNAEMVLSPSRLLSMATSQFNFFQPTPSPSPSPSPVKKPTLLKYPSSPTKHNSGKSLLLREGDLSETVDGYEDMHEPSLAATNTQPSAWSTDSLPVYNATSSNGSEPSSSGDPHASPQKTVSASRRKA